MCKLLTSVSQLQKLVRFTKLYCQHCQSSMADPDFKHELSVLAKLAVPLIFVGACDQFSKVLTTIFAGQYLSTKLFEAIAFGNSMTNITGLSMIVAFVSPMDSICTQANGARDWDLYSLTVWRALICTFLFLIPTVILWINMDSVLVACGQDASISANVHRWTLIYLSILPAYVIRTIASRFLSSQGISKPMLIITPIVCLLWHPLL